MSKLKCFICRKTLSTLMSDIYKCKCEKFCCRYHMHNHDCNFDYIKFNQDILSKELLKIESQKINKIENFTESNNIYVKKV